MVAEIIALLRCSHARHCPTATIATTRNLFMKRASLPKLFTINAYWLGLSFMWNSLHVIILPAVLLHYVPDQLKNTYLGLLTFFGLVIAMIVQPISGAKSDRWRSSWGRRRPLILAGTLVDYIFLAVLGWAGGLLWLAVGYIGLQFSSNVAHGPAQGLLPDHVPPEQMGAASAIKNLADMLGLVISSLLMGRLVDPDIVQPLLPIAIVGAVLAVGAAITLLGVHELPSLQPVPESKQPHVNDDSSVPNAVQPSLKSSFAWLIASRFAFLLGIYDIQVFAQYYIRDVIVVDNPVKLTGDLLAAITVALVIFSLIGGWLGDRIGHHRLIYIACAVAAAGSSLLLLAHTPVTLLLSGAVLGSGIGLFLTSNWALFNELTPLAKAGMYLGLTNLATAGAGAVGRLGGPLIDFLNNANPGLYTGYSAMFIFGAVCSLVSALLLWKAKRIASKAGLIPQTRLV
jgi:MFS family permease